MFYKLLKSSLSNHGGVWTPLCKLLEGVSTVPNSLDFQNEKENRLGGGTPLCAIALIVQGHSPTQFEGRVHVVIGGFIILHFFSFNSCNSFSYADVLKSCQPIVFETFLLVTALFVTDLQKCRSKVLMNHLMALYK